MLVPPVDQTNKGVQQQQQPLKHEPEGISGTRTHLIMHGVLAMKNSDSYTVITNK